MANPIWLLTLIGSQPPQPTVFDPHVQILVGDLDGRLLAELTCQVGPVAWRLKGVSCTAMEIARTDDKAIEKYIRPGKRVLLRFSNGLPDWGGVIDPPMKWTNRGTIQFCARSIDFLLSLRQTDQERNFTAAPAGQIAKALIDDANNLSPTGITVGEMWQGGEGYTLSYHHDDLYKIIDQDLTAPGLSSGDFWIEAEEDGNGYIVFTARFAERRGKDRPEVAFIEGHNISDVTLTTQGPIVNAWTVIGAGNAWGEDRAYGYAEDAYSISLYGLRQANEARTDLDIDAQLDAVADSLVAKHKQPHHILTLGVANLAPGTFASYDVGDSVRVILETFGFGGYDNMVRILAREYNPMAGRCRLVVEEEVVIEG